MTTEEMLDFLSEIGQPWLSRQDDGRWHAAVKFPAPKGIKAEVGSDFTRLTYKAALQQVIERVKGLKTMGDDVGIALRRLT